MPWKHSVALWSMITPPVGKLLSQDGISSQGLLYGLVIARIVEFGAIDNQVHATAKGCHIAIPAAVVDKHPIHSRPLGAHAKQPHHLEHRPRYFLVRLAHHAHLYLGALNSPRQSIGKQRLGHHHLFCAVAFFNNNLHCLSFAREEALKRAHISLRRFLRPLRPDCRLPLNGI